MAAELLLPQLQTILFVSGEPVSFSRLSKILRVSKKDIEQTVEALAQKLQTDALSGLMLIQNGEAVELATKKEYGLPLEALAKSTLQEKLSQAALEVLAIVAYRAPITRSHIEAIRGVNCSFTLRNLLLRGLIERSGNPEDAREYVYAPAFAFLEKLGLPSVKELPDYMTLSRDERLDLVLDHAEPLVQTENS